MPALARLIVAYSPFDLRPILPGAEPLRSPPRMLLYSFRYNHFNRAQIIPVDPRLKFFKKGSANVWWRNGIV